MFLYCIKYMFFSESKVLLVYLCYYSNITINIDCYFGSFTKKDADDEKGMRAVDENLPFTKWGPYLATISVTI